jgi:glutamine amidotransferase
MTVLIIDYGLGNLASTRRSFEECGAVVAVSDDPCAVLSAASVVVPGVGTFGQAMERLRHRGWLTSIREAAAIGVPVLGICLGMQLLADRGEEGGECEGLGLVEGRVERMLPVRPEERIPHVGWNEVLPAASSHPIFRGIRSGTDFYFAHSYRFIPAKRHDVIATTPYCGELVSAVRNNNVVGVQFHPEKSSRAGLQLIRNFLSA